jgi:hypothetical protein
MSPTSPANPTQPTKIPPDLLQEIETFRKLCDRRYHFNSHWDTILNGSGVIVSLGIVAAGVYKQSEWAAMLGGLIACIVSLQRAFPFSQRWQFYRLLDSQAENLLTEARNGIITVEQTIATMKAMRLDFAQQIPRGSSFRSDSSANTDAPGPADNPPSLPTSSPPAAGQP